jgi:hypothetical protein
MSTFAVWHRIRQELVSGVSLFILNKFTHSESNAEVKPGREEIIIRKIKYRESNIDSYAR